MTYPPVCIVAVGAFAATRMTLFQCVAVTNVVSAVAYAGVYARGKWKTTKMPESVSPPPMPAPGGAE